MEKVSSNKIDEEKRCQSNLKIGSFLDAFLVTGNNDCSNNTRCKERKIGLSRMSPFCTMLVLPIHGRGIPRGSVQHFKPKRVLTRLHPETGDNRHKRFAQHIGGPGGASPLPSESRRRHSFKSARRALCSFPVRVPDT
jgi:hypothetical protein